MDPNAAPPVRVHYAKLPGLKDVYLEDSYVLSIVDEPGTFKLTLQVVLTEAHPSYERPVLARYAYRLAVLEFRDVVRVTWARRSKRKYRDADGRVDYGNVDVFYRERGADDEVYHLEGDWGVVDLVSAPPILRLVE